jgi:hypothetical protein
MCNRDKPWIVASYEFRQNMIQLESGSCSYVDSRDMNRGPMYLTTSMLLRFFLVAHLMFIIAKSAGSLSNHESHTLLYTQDLSWLEDSFFCR